MPYADPAKRAACLKAHMAVPENRRKHYEVCQRWRQKNRAKVVAYALDYQRRNPEKVAAAVKAFREQHPERYIAASQRRRARLLNAPVNDLTVAQWKAIKAHYRQCCVYCGKKQKRLTQDHIVPLSKGGSHTYTNIVPACKSCNSKKGARAPLIAVQPLLLIA